MEYNIFDRHQFALSNSFIIEMSLIIISFVLSYVLKKFLNRKFFINAKQITGVKNQVIQQRFIRNYPYVSLPLYFVLFLIISDIVSSAALKLETNILVSVTQFAIIWFLLRLITVVSGSKSPKLIVIIIAVILFLDIFDLTQVTIESLEGISIKFGSFNLSAFLIVKAIIATIISFWVINLISRISRKIVSNFTSLNISAKNITTVIVDITLYFILFLIILKLIGFDITAIAVLGSAVGIGIGFGLQKITSNFISGLILLFEKSIKEGDVVELSTNPNEIGFIKRMGIRYTLVRTFDNKEIMMPNEDFITNRVTNWTFSDREVRIRIPIGVDYGSDLELVKKLILEAANENIEEDIVYKPVCFLDAFGDSSVDFILFVWVSNVNLVQNAKRSDILFSIWNKFKENNITIPFPQRDLHLKSSDLKNIK